MELYLCSSCNMSLWQFNVLHFGLCYLYVNNTVVDSLNQYWKIHTDTACQQYALNVATKLAAETVH